MPYLKSKSSSRKEQVFQLRSLPELLYASFSIHSLRNVHVVQKTRYVYEGL